MENLVRFQKADESNKNITIKAKSQVRQNLSIAALNDSQRSIPGKEQRESLRGREGGTSNSTYNNSFYLYSAPCSGLRNFLSQRSVPDTDISQSQAKTGMFTSLDTSIYPEKQQSRVQSAIQQNRSNLKSVLSNRNSNFSSSEMRVSYSQKQQSAKGSQKNSLILGKAATDFRKRQKQELGIGEMDKYTVELLPEWIRRRQEFIKVYYKDGVQKTLEIAQLCTKKENERTSKQIDEACSWIVQHCEAMRDMQAHLLRQFVQRLCCVVLWEKEIYLDYGDTCDAFFIVYSGNLAKISSTEKTRNRQKMLQTGATQNFVEALVSNPPQCSRHRFQALSAQCVLLTLSQECYVQICAKEKERLRGDLATHVQLAKLFQKSSKAAIEKFCEQSQGLIFLSNQYVYRQGAHPEKLYMVCRGTVKKQLEFTKSLENRWPRENLNQENKNSYQGCHRQKFAFTKEKLINCYEFFGHEELVERVICKSSAKTAQHCFILCVTSQQFFDIFTEYQVREFRNEAMQTDEFLEVPEHSEQCQRILYNREKLLHALREAYRRESNLEKLATKQKKFAKFENYIKQKDFYKDNQDSVNILYPSNLRSNLNTQRLSLA